jgi:hypothetical protein
MTRMSVQGIRSVVAPLPHEAPAGIDPALWSVLTAAERAMVELLGAMGPLAYGRFTQPRVLADDARGGRLDVRV